MNFTHAVDELTRPWTDVVTIRENGDTQYRAVEHEPLLDMLRAMISSNISGLAGKGDLAAERNVINVKAFTLWETIDGKARAWWRDLSKARSSPELKDLVRELAGLLQAQRAIGGVDDLMLARVTLQFSDWRREIWEMFDPPIVKELSGACPKCEERHVYAPDGAQSSALIAYYVKSEMPEAKCQRCSEVWVGARQLLTLGYHIGATVDVEALKEMGVESEGAA